MERSTKGSKMRSFLPLVTRKLAGILLLLIITCYSYAQILPKEGCSLNYRMVGLLFPEGKRGHSYKIEIAAGNYNNEDTFRKNIIRTLSSSRNNIIIEVPSFGKQYTWRVVQNVAPSIVSKSELHHFSTKTNPNVDTGHMRLKIMKHTDRYKDAYVFMDGTKTLYDMNGKPVWFLPMLDDKPADKIWGFGDLNFTGQGTITYLTTPKGGQVYEADLNGNVLWKGPNDGKVSGDSIEHYNHEVIRLRNGHYMVLGGEYLFCKLPSTVDTSFLNDKKNINKIKKDSNNIYSQKLFFGTVIEYDEHSNIVWSWKSSSYFLRSDLMDHVAANGTFDIEDVHTNSLYFDEKNKAIYVGFRDISRIVKVKYPEGVVANVYGKCATKGSPGYENPVYYHQHSCRLSQDGYLYMYNNNSRYKGALPSIVMIRENVPMNDTIEKVWEYKCTTEGFDLALKQVPEFTSLGSVLELPDRSLLACMTAQNYSRVFIVDRDKKILWDAMLQRWEPTQHKWYSVIQYRANMITDRKILEDLIWKAESQVTADGN